MYILTTNEMDRKDKGKGKYMNPSVSLYDVNRKVEYELCILGHGPMVSVNATDVMGEMEISQIAFKDHQAIEFWEQLIKIVTPECQGFQFDIPAKMTEALGAARDAWMGSEDE